jgi:iron complex transport system permease protein
MSDFITGRGKALTAKRLWSIVGVCLVATAIVAVIAPLIGAGMTRDGFRVELMGPSAFEPGSTDHVVLWTVRVPRVLATLLVGGALAGAGAALQALLRNPLAEPFTLGISSGSSLAAVLAIRLGLDSVLGAPGVGTAALAGAALTLLLVERLARIGRHLPAATLVLAGVTISMSCAGASVIVQYTSDFAEISRMLRWMMGGFDTVRLEVIGWAAIPIGVGLVVLLMHARSLDAIAAGPEVAASLGVSVPRTERVVFATASLLVGVAIALAGPIGFIGLIVPHAVRALFGPDHRVLLPASVFGGAILLTVCDTLARIVIAPAQLPTGALTAMLGGPFFIYLLLSQRRRAALWG